MCPGAFAGGTCSPRHEGKGAGKGKGKGKGQSKGQGKGKGGGKGNGKDKGRQAAANAANAESNKRKIEEIKALIDQRYDQRTTGAEEVGNRDVQEVPAPKKVNANTAQSEAGVKSMTPDQLSKLEAIIARKDAQKKKGGESSSGYSWRGRGKGRGHGGGRGSGKHGGSGKGGERHWRRPT